MLPARLGAWPVTGLAAAVTAGAAAAAYVVWRNTPWVWPLQDALSMCFMLMLLRQFHLPNLKVRGLGARLCTPLQLHGAGTHVVFPPAPAAQVASILLPLAFCYDIWWVFVQPLVFGGTSVMVEVATGGASREQMPMVLRVPQANSLGTNPAFSILGAYVRGRDWRGRVGVGGACGWVRAAAAAAVNRRAICSHPCSRPQAWATLCCRGCWRCLRAAST